ncbi:MAG: M23 family metallopeptidase [Chloroflexi bacterium]|nr:M23 family metallopeptidase [Chloroflexota bacterium]MCC6892223.1 M23 family metallopeptidase [Anaerolineae bacterium]
MVAFRWLAAGAVLLLMNLAPAAAQDNAAKPFILPLAEPASPSTWLMGQAYGNTTGAFNYGTAWYAAGQGLHFGIDITMPCGTPVIAMADGEVIYTDNLTFGSGPHNLIMRHSQAGVTVLYGHLLERPTVQQYQTVKQGDVVGLSGDPDVTCDSRPHLHLEVRSLDYQIAYNPISYINAPWDALVSIGSYSRSLFEQDFYNPRQWMSLDDQPPTAFGGARLNAYAESWPPKNEDTPPQNTPPMRPYTALPAGTWGMQPLTMDGCCAVHWWNPTDSNLAYVIDGSPGQLAAIFEWDVTAKAMTGVIESVPPRQLSPDGSYRVIRGGGEVTVRRLADGVDFPVQTSGFPPAVSPDNSHLLWEVQYGQDIPGATPPQVEIWVSNIDGSNARAVLARPDISATWLDGARLLISTSDRTLTTLDVLNVDDGSTFTLGTWDRIRGVSIAPGGERILFYQTFQADPNVNGIYLLEAQSGAVPQKMAWFGGWRWRDAQSLYYIPFDPVTGVQSMHYYDLTTGEDRALTDPATTNFTVANGDWSVSPDGTRILFQNAADRRLWVLEAQPE